MAGARDNRFGFAAPEDVPIAYMERTRRYYAALGYGAPYEWAHFAAVPFQPLHRPLAQSRVALVTTAALQRPGQDGTAKFYQVYSGDTAQDHALGIGHVAIDRKHTTGEDQGSYFPLAALRRAAASGRIGSLAPRFHGAPTNRSHRATIEIDVPEIVARCQADAADAAILVANCPVCHQSLALAARMLEENGIATVVMGCAKDIVEHVGVPRLLFSDFPLGNAAGWPNDLKSQAFTLGLALDVLEAAPGPRTTVQSPLRWNDDPAWKLDYCNVDRLAPEEILRLRGEFDRQKERARTERDRVGINASYKEIQP